MTDGRDRRSVLRAGAALCSAFAAGCLGDGGGGEDDGERNRTNGTMPGGPGKGTDPIDNGTDPGGDESDPGENETDPGGNETDPDEDPEDPGDGEPEPEPVTAWPMQQYGPKNTAAVDAAPPRDDVGKRWTYDLDAELFASPVVSDGTIYVVDRNAGVYAIDEEGNRLWKTSVQGDGLDRTPAIWEDLLVVPRGGGITALNRVTGSTAWKHETDRDPRDVTAAEGVVAFGTNHEFLYCLDAQSGDAEWVYNPRVYHGEDFAYAPIIHDGEVIAHDQDWETIAIDIETEEKRVLVSHDKAIRSPITLRDGTIYGGGNDGIYAYDVESGEREWFFPTSATMETGLAVDGDTVYAASPYESTPQLYAISTDGGEARWSVDSWSLIRSGPIVVGDTVAKALPSSRAIAGYAAETGEELWRVDVSLHEIQQGAYVEGALYFGAKKSLVCISQT